VAAIALGAAIVAFFVYRAGLALWALTGRERNDVLALAWPASLWVVWLILLYMAVPATALSAGEPAGILIAACVAVSLVHASALGWVWRRMRTDR
jgi:hypothetical protein